jgi:PAS domain S-box-containing protein
MESAPQIYREMFERVAAGFCVIKLKFEDGEAVDYRFVEVNAAFNRTSGLVNAKGRWIRELVPTMEAYWFRLFGRVAKEGKSLQFEREIHALGRWYSVDASPIGEPEEHLVAVLFFDITARKRMELDLSESEARFSALADGIPMPVWVLDDLGEVRFVNSAFTSYFAVSEAQLRGPWWREIVHPEDISAFEDGLKMALQERRELSLLARARRHDGQWRVLEMNARPRHAADGRFIGLAGNSPDVTERREIELASEQLLDAERAARNTAEQMARVKDEFLATLSHELRTPLTTILGWSEMLLSRMEQEHPLRKGVSVIASSALLQKRLISDMLDLSGMLLGKVKLEVEVLDLCEQVQEVAYSQELVVEDKTQQMVLKLPPTPCLVLGDAMRLQQILSNLLSNAIKFTPADGVIQVSVAEEGGYCLIEVSDNGEGISEEFLSLLFNRFSQADGTTTRRHGGLGLGLSIVQHLVELHGGSITAHSEGKEKGASFVVRLPAYRANAHARPRRTVHRGPAIEQVVEPYMLKGLRVLAVEDQLEVLAYLRRLLEEQGAEVVGLDSAAAALELLGQPGERRFDVLLSDIGMPGMDGYGLVRTVRETLGISPEALPAIAVTALARTDDRLRALQVGFQGHLPKPYSLAQLVAAVRDVCRLY